MKLKIFIASFFFLVILVVVSFFFSSESPKPTPSTAALPQQEPAQEEAPARDYSYLLPSTASLDPAITIIRQATPKKKTAPPLPIVEEIQSQAEESISQPPAPENNPSNTDASAIPVKHKYPTEDQKKEMRSRNAVLF